MKVSLLVLLPSTEFELAQLGEQLRLARLRRGQSVDAVAAAASLSRATVFRVEKGSPSVALGAYARVLEVLGLAGNLALLARDDLAGRQLQDQQLPSRRAVHEPADALWRFKRKRQQQDIEAIRSGRSTNEAMSWFTPGWTSQVQVLQEPF